MYPRRGYLSSFMYSLNCIKNITKSLAPFPCMHTTLPWILASTNRRRLSHSSCSSDNIYHNTTIHNINFAGNTIQTTVTTNTDVITQWINNTLSIHWGERIIVGLDIEWKPNFIKNTKSKAATLQLCINNRCLIIQLIYLNTIPRSLKDFLSSTELEEDVTFVGVAVESDAAKLEREYDLKCNKMKDLQKTHEGGRRKQIGLKTLAREVAGLDMSKPKNVTVSDWAARVLSKEQIEYACIDAYASYMIAKQLKV